MMRRKAISTERSTQSAERSYNPFPVRREWQRASLAEPPGLLASHHVFRDDDSAIAVWPGAARADFGFDVKEVRTVGTLFISLLKRCTDATIMLLRANGVKDNRIPLQKRGPGRYRIANPDLPSTSSRNDVNTPGKNRWITPHPEDSERPTTSATLDGQIAPNSSCLTDAEQAFVDLVGHYVRQVRRVFNYSREELAKELEISVEPIAVVEDGDGNPETASRLYLLVKSHRMTLEHIVEE